MESVQSWTIPAEWRECCLIARLALAPQLESLLMHINTPCSNVEGGPPTSIIELGPTVKSVHVTSDHPDQQMLLVNRWPSQELVHVHLLSG